MSSLAVLVGPSGDAAVSLQVLCDGVPLPALSLVDPATHLANVRFVAPGPGRLTVRLSNGGLAKGAFVRLERAEMGPRDAWDECCDDFTYFDCYRSGDHEGSCRRNVVNKANVLPHGRSLTVQRDESTGGRSMLVEALRDARGRAVGELAADLQGVRRTKWRLGLWPEESGALLEGFEWRLLDAEPGRVVPLRVITPTRQAMLAVPANASVDSLKAILERELGIPRAEQQLCGDWPSPVRPCSWYAQQGLFPATLHVCGGQRAGPTVWLQVQHQQGRTLVVAQSSDKLQAVLDKVPGHIDHVHGLYRDGQELRLDRTLTDHGLACLHSLEMRERGCMQALIGVPAGSACPSTSVLVGFDPEDTVEELCKRAAFKIGGAVLDQYRVNPNFSLFLRDEEVAGDRLVAHCSQTGSGVWLSMRKRMPLRDLAIEIYVKTLTGKTITLNCNESDTIQMVKQAITASAGIPPDQQRLVWSRRQLLETCTLLDYGVGHRSTLDLILRLRGGGSHTAVAQGALAADEDAAAPEGAEPVPAPPAPPAQPQRAATQLAVGRILSGEVVPPPETVGCRFVVRWHSSVKLQFDVFVQEQKA